MSTLIATAIKATGYCASGLRVSTASSFSRITQISVVPCRHKYYHNRHRDPKYRRERGRKQWPVFLPDFHEKDDSSKLTPDEIRAKMKEKGIAPPAPWNEKPLFSGSTQAIAEPYSPKDEEKSSLLDYVKSPLGAGKDLIQNRRSLKTIRLYEGEEFEYDNFAKSALPIYMKAHQALADHDEANIFNYVTEYCFPLMTAGLSRHTIHWKLIEEVEPASVVHARVIEVEKFNVYVQLTVRMHTKQMLAVYDRHGRLVHGSPSDVKEVIEYIVFEKHASDEFGVWRMHGKISSNMDPDQAASKTYVVNRVAEAVV